MSNRFSYILDAFKPFKAKMSGSKAFQTGTKAIRTAGRIASPMVSSVAQRVAPVIQFRVMPAVRRNIPKLKNNVRSAIQVATDLNDLGNTIINSKARKLVNALERSEMIDPIRAMKLRSAIELQALKEGQVFDTPSGNSYSYNQFSSARPTDFRPENFETSKAKLIAGVPEIPNNAIKRTARRVSAFRLGQGMVPEGRASTPQDITNTSDLEWILGKNNRAIDSYKTIRTGAKGLGAAYTVGNAYDRIFGKRMSKMMGGKTGRMGKEMVDQEGNQGRYFQKGTSRKAVKFYETEKSMLKSNSRKAVKFYETEKSMLKSNSRRAIKFHEITDENYYGNRAKPKPNTIRKNASIGNSVNLNGSMNNFVTPGQLIPRRQMMNIATPRPPKLPTPMNPMNPMAQKVKGTSINTYNPYPRAGGMATGMGAPTMKTFVKMYNKKYR
jgi:hypothetical protein